MPLQTNYPLKNKTDWFQLAKISLKTQQIDGHVVIISKQEISSQLHARKT